MPTQEGRDIYYRRAKQEGWRARSAFKLLQIDEAFDIFQGVYQVVDLCAAPGSWSQVLSRQLYLPYIQGKRCNSSKPPKIVAIDLQPIGAVEGVEMIQGDITDEATAKQVMAIFAGNKADLVVCDGAPDVTGLHDVDEYVQSQLLLAALAIVTNILRSGGTFVAKIFTKGKADLLFSQMKILFGEVYVFKPRSSRAASAESFIICKRFTLPEGMTSTSLLRQWNASDNNRETWSTTEKVLLPFLTGGDLSGYQLPS